MSVDNTALMAVRILLAIRNSRKGEMTGTEINIVLGSVPGNLLATGKYSNESDRILKMLVRIKLLDVRHVDNGNSAPLDPDTFEASIPQNDELALRKFAFSISSRLEDVQKTLGIHSLKELEQRAMGNTISVEPLFGRVQYTFTNRFNDTIFVAMPFKDDLLPVFTDCIEPVVSSLNKQPVRADSIFTERTIMSDVWHAIYSAFAIIVDCTGRNANVFYELGIAHTIGKKCIILTQDDSDIPFDINQFRYLKYSNDEEGLQKLQEALKNSLLQLADGDEHWP